MLYIKLHSDHLVLIISKQHPQTNETQSDMKCITIDLGFNLFVYALNGGSKTATQDCPITICYAAVYGVCERELGGDEGAQISTCVFGCLCMSVGVFQWTTRKSAWSLAQPFSKMKRGEKKQNEDVALLKFPRSRV